MSQPKLTILTSWSSHQLYILTLSGTTPLLWTFGTGGGQKHLRYIIQIYISQFKSDYSGVKSKSEVHIIRSHLEKKNCKNFQKWTSYRCFCLPFENSKKIWEKKILDSKSFLLGQFSKYWGLVFCKHPKYDCIKGFYIKFGCYRGPGGDLISFICFWNFFEGPNWDMLPKNLCCSLLLIH